MTRLRQEASPGQATRRLYLERAIILIAQAAQQVAHSPAEDASEIAERKSIVDGLEAIAKECADVLIVMQAGKAR